MNSDLDSNSSDDEFETLEPWVKMQHTTFCNWINESLKTVNQEVNDLSKDLRSGEKLCILMNVLKGKSIGKILKNPVNHYAASGNIELAFQAMKKDGVKLVNIGAEDISKGSLKLIFGLIWTLIRTYQFKSSGKLPPKKMMLAFFNAILHPFREVKNFSTDWNDGVALHGVIEYCKPGTFPDWMNLKSSKEEENCRNGLETSYTVLKTPIVIKPEHMSDPKIDELSVMTQLSYYVTEGSPGYDKTMEWVNSKLSVSRITNFSTNWNDGKILTELITELGADIPDVQGEPNKVCEAAMKASESQLGVRRVISPTDMTIPTVDHIGVMAYAAWHRNVPDRPERKKKLKFAVEPQVIMPSPTPPIKTPSPPPVIVPAPAPPSILSSKTFKEDTLVRKTEIERQSRQSVNSSVVSSTMLSSISSNTSSASTLPVAPKSVSFKRQEIIVYILDTWRVDATLNIMVDTSAFGNGAVRAEAHSPATDIEDLHVTRTEDSVNFISFRPTERGNWKIQIFYDNQEISESPYYVNVYDPSLARIIKTQIGKASLLKDYNFEVDCLQVGCKELDVFVTQNENQVPKQINLCGNDRYKVTFQPKTHGIFNVSVFVGGIESPGSPFLVDATDNKKVHIDGLALKECICGKEALFTILANSAPDKEAEVIILSPSGQNLRSTVQKVTSERYNVSFVPREEGNHIVEVFYDASTVQGSPFVTNARKPKIVVRNLETIVQKDRDYMFEIDASEVIDNGTIEIDSACPVKGYKQTGVHKYTVTYRPTDIGTVDFIIKYQHIEINGSPYKVEVQENGLFPRSLIR